ncbi:MAG: DUF5906 domain-containing protein [Bacteroidota bacterium]|nr:DUF5906 domain-containing protein [Bacteroidota bacterium]
MTINPTTNHERLIKLSLHPIDYSGTATDYQPNDVNVNELQNVLTSHNYSPIIWLHNHRKKENFSFATGFCLDIDKGMTISEAESILLKNNLNYALVTTKSHKSDAHRFRVLIPFSRKLLTFHQYELAALSIDKLFNSKCDDAVFDGARQLYGSPTGAYYKECWTGNDYDVTPFTGFDLSSLLYGTGDFNDNLIVKDSNGNEISIKDIDKKMPICCPFHEDTTPSAFIEFSKDSDNWFIRCSTCAKTYWKTKLRKPIDERCKDFWSHTSKIYEMGITGDHYHFKEIGEKKFYSFIGAFDKNDKAASFDWLLKHHHISNILRIDYIGDPLAREHTYEVKKDEGLVEVKFTALPVEIQNNQFIEDFLDSTFGEYKEFIKQYMAVYSYTDFRKLPTLILVGDRGVGKSKFAEMLAEIYPQRSQFWTAKEENFNTELQKKLLIADETVTSKKENYLYLKRISGQNYHPINEKFQPKYQVKNNVNVIILSNSLLPVFVEREEFPTSTANNQFFVHKIQPFKGELDAQIAEKLKARLGYYVRTVLKKVYNRLDMSKYRYSIPVPITSDEQKLFHSSMSIEQMVSDTFVQKLVEKYPAYHEFMDAGYVPIDIICDELNISKQDKRSIVHNLRERNYISPDNVVRKMFGDRREYCFKMTEILKSKIDTDIKIDCIGKKEKVSSH